ncbi:MAG TPA: hypothetical protein VFC78_20580 [Tepidisphaeraceae bacterium]|nr:hypothetical protein [Tepidisphaeraceae bacterium]
MKRTRNILLALCAMAFLLRIGAIVYLHSWKNPDPMEHRSIAWSLVKTGCFCFTDFHHRGPTSFQSPPYPFLLAGLFELFGPDTPRAYLAAMVINSLVGAGTVALTYFLAITLGGKRTVGLVAAAAVAVWPTQIYACTVAQAIVLITAAITAVMALFYVSIRTGKAGPWIAFGLIGCLAALTEPAFLPAMMLSGIIILFVPRLHFDTRLRNAIMLLGAGLLVLGPWTYRNYLVHDALVPVKSSFWVNTWKGNNDLASGTDRIGLSKSDRARLDPFSIGDPRNLAVDGDHAYKALSLVDRNRLNYKNELEREKIFKELTVNWIATHRARYAQLCWIRLVKTIWIDWQNPKSYNIVYIASRAVLLITTAFGVLLALWQRWSLGFPALMFCSTLLLYTLTITAARFALPFEPLMLCFSALAATTIWGKIVGRGAPEAVDALVREPKKREPRMGTNAHG